MSEHSHPLERAVIIINRPGHEPVTLKDPSMTRAARTERVEQRLQDLEGWRRGLQEHLTHYRAEYPYDVAHEYDIDQTTDPDYVWPKVHLTDYDDDGFPLPDHVVTSFMLYTQETCTDRLGARMAWSPDIYFGDGLAKRINRFTRQGTPKNLVSPDLVALLPQHTLPPTQPYRDFEDCVIRTQQGDDAPEWALKYLSSTADWKRNDDRLRVYAALGINEYVVYDPGSKRAPDSQEELLAYRLDSESCEYHPVNPDPDLSEANLPAYPSKVFGTHIRINPLNTKPRKRYVDIPTFQWYDADGGCWRDHASDERIQRERDRQARQGNAESVQFVIDAVQVILEKALKPKVREHVAAFWRQHGYPHDVLDRLVAVKDDPDQWPFLLLDPPEYKAEPEEAPATFQRRLHRGEAIGYLSVMLQTELDGQTRGQVARLWREQGPPEDWFESIRAVQAAPDQWRDELLRHSGSAQRHETPRQRFEAAMRAEQEAKDRETNDEAVDTGATRA